MATEFVNTRFVRQRGSDTYDRIVAAAAKLFAERGYHATSVREIIAEAGVTRATLYYHVPTKEALLEQILADTHDAFYQVAREAVSRPPDSCISRLDRLIRAHITLSHELAHGVIIFTASAAAIPEDIMERKHKRQREYESIFVNLFTEGIASGELRPDLNPKITSFHVLGMLNWTSRWYKPSGPLSLDEIADGIIDFILQGVRRPGA
jgi:TetR/AcrR family transcriptional regulator, cholesterol catabolism regulator